MMLLLLVLNTEICRQHGRNFVHVIWLSIIAWIFSVVALADCTFVRNGFEGASYTDLSELGLFGYNLASDERQCVSYSNTVNFSAAAKTARAFGVICCLLTSFIMLQVLSLQMFLQPKREFVWKSTRFQVIAAPLAQILTFTVLGDDVCLEPNAKCVPGAAGIVALINVFVLIALACVCWINTSPEQPLYEIKRLEALPLPEQKPTTVDDIESEGHSMEARPEEVIFSFSKRVEDASEDIESQPEQAVKSSFKRNEDTAKEAVLSSKHNEDTPADEVDEVVKSIGADIKEGAYPVHSVRPISPDSEKRRLSFGPRHSKGKIETSNRMEI